jgi:hypothetical protein
MGFAQKPNNERGSHARSYHVGSCFGGRNCL